MARRAMLSGLVLIVAGLALATQIDSRWKPEQLLPANRSVDVFSDRVSVQFSVRRSGHYVISLTAEQNRPFDEVYCLLRGPTDYWSSVTCEKTVRFSADWALRENYRLIDGRKMIRSPAGIATFNENDKTYLRRHLGRVTLTRGHYYTLTLTLNGVDVNLRDSRPRLQVRVDETDVEAAGWLSLSALILSPLLFFGGAWLLVSGLVSAARRAD